MANGFAVHDVNAILEYALDWTDWRVSGEEIETSTWTGPAGITLTASLNSPYAIVKVEVTDLTLRGRVRLTNHVVSSDGQEDDRILALYMTQRQ